MLSVTKIYPISPSKPLRMVRSDRSFLDETDCGSVLVEQNKNSDKLRVRGKYSLTRAAEIILGEIVRDMPKDRAIHYLAMLSANVLNENRCARGLI